MRPQPRPPLRCAPAVACPAVTATASTAEHVARTALTRAAQRGDAQGMRRDSTGERALLGVSGRALAIRRAGDEHARARCAAAAADELLNTGVHS